MTEATRLQAVMAACLEDYAEDHGLSPRQGQVCHHVLDGHTETQLCQPVAPGHQ